MKSLSLQVESSPCSPRLARLPRRRVLLSAQEGRNEPIYYPCVRTCHSYFKAQSPFVLDSSLGRRHPQSSVRNEELDAQRLCIVPVMQLEDREQRANQRSLSGSFSHTCHSLLLPAGSLLLSHVQFNYHGASKQGTFQNPDLENGSSQISCV